MNAETKKATHTDYRLLHSEKAHPGKKIGSYIDFYGVHLPGEPFYWSIGIIAVMTFVGYRLGARVRAA